MMKMRSIVFFLLLGMLSDSNAKKILVLPWTHYSHCNFFALAAKALQNDGHEVTLLISETNEAKMKKHGVPYITYSFPPEGDPMAPTQGIGSEVLKDQSIFSVLSIMREVGMRNNALIRHILTNDILMEQLRSAQYDLAVMDNFPVAGALWLVSQELGLPYVFLGQFYNPWASGLPVLPAIEPVQVMNVEQPMSFLNRIKSTIISFFLYNLQFAPYDDKMIEDLINKKPVKTIRQMSMDAEMWLITQDIHCFNKPRISTANYRFIGSISASKPPKPLNNDLQSFVDSAKHGIVVVSFGSLISWRQALIPYIGKLLDALERLEQKTILQFTREDLSDYIISDKIMVSSWLPQNDLLGQNKTKLFISHGGINSHLEATYRGVPILTFPYQPEQRGNGLRAKAMKHGDVLEWKTSTAEEIYETIVKLIQNPVYKENVNTCAAILQSLPPADKQFVFWVNHILEYGSDHLRYSGQALPWWQFWMVDVIGTIGLICFVILWSCCWCLRKCFCKTSSKIKSKRD